MIRNSQGENCSKHNLELKYLNPNQSNQQQKLACRYCIDEFYNIIPIEQIKESNQELIQDFKSQTQSNQVLMNLLIHSLLFLREEINKKIENLINEIRNQIQINEHAVEYIQTNALNKNEIKLHHENSIKVQMIFQKNAIQLIESLKQNSSIDQMIQAFMKLNNESLNYDTQNKKTNILEIRQQLNFNQTNDIQCMKKYEYQLVPEATIEHNESYFSIAFNKDNSVIAIGNIREIQVFEFKNEQLQEIQQLKGHNNVVSCLQFMKSGNSFLSGSWDESIKIWEQGPNCKWVNVETLVGHKGWIYCLIINNNDNLIITAGFDDSILIWKTFNNQWSNDQKVYCSNQILSLSLNDANNSLVASNSSKLIQIFLLKENKWQLTQTINTKFEVLRLCFVSDTNFLFLPDCSEYLYQYNFNTANEQFQKVNQLTVKNDRIDCPGFPMQFINSRNLLIVKNGKFLNIVNKQDNDILIIDQQIEFDDYNTFGSTSNDGQFLLTWNLKSSKIELRKLVQIL